MPTLFLVFTHSLLFSGELEFTPGLEARPLKRQETEISLPGYL
jgi:hypothetical protein